MAINTEKKEFDIRLNKLPENELRSQLTKKVRNHDRLHSRMVSEMPIGEDIDGAEGADWQEAVTIDKAIETGLKGESTPLYDDIRKTIKEEDKVMYKQLYSHEEGKKYEGKAKLHHDKKIKQMEQVERLDQKIKTKKVVRVGLHEEKKIGKDGEPVSTVKRGIYKEEVKLRKGERTLGQKLQYESAHQTKEAIRKDMAEEEEKEGNDGVQLAHSTETTLKNKIVKPYIRDHFGYDRYHVKQEKLLKQSTINEAKETVNQRMSEQLIETNPVSKMLQKKRIKREVYRDKGLYLSPMQRFKNIVGGMWRTTDPLYKVKQTWHTISTICGAVAGLFQTLLTAGGSLIIVIIPLIAIVCVFSLFFNFGSSNTYVSLGNTTTQWSEQLTDIRMEIIEADETESYAGYYTDEVRLVGSVNISVQQEKLRQIQLIGYISALYQDNLTESIARNEVREAFDELYEIVVEDYVDEGWWETVYVGTDDEGNAEYEEVWVEYWVLYLSLKQDDINAYALDKLNAIPDEDERELALLQYEQYQEGYGYSQIGGNPLSPDNSFDWRNSISSLFGYRIMSNNKEMHRGLDIAIPENTSLYAIADGVVTRVNSNPNSSDSGIYVYYEIEIGGELYEIKYLHLNSYTVSVGDTIKKGDLIAYSGNTGRSTGAHLHLQIENDGTPCNPLFMVEFPM